MAYRSHQLAPALGWKFPGLQGVTTSDHYLNGWPTLPWPTDAEQAQYVSDYQSYLASNQAKDDDLQTFLDSAGGKVVKAIALVLVDKGVCTLAEIRAKYRSL